MGLFSPSYHRLCEQGILAFNAGDFETASERFLSAIQKDQQAPRAFGWLGMTYQAATNRSDGADAAQWADLAIRAFGEAINHETDPDLKAEFLWQRGVTFGSMSRPEEQNASWKEADKIVPGFVEKRRTAVMDALKDA